MMTTLEVLSMRCTTSATSLSLPAISARPQPLDAERRATGLCLERIVRKCQMRNAGPAQAVAIA